MYKKHNLLSFSYNVFKGRFSQCQENSGLCRKGSKGKSLERTFLTYIYKITAFSPSATLFSKTFFHNVFSGFCGKDLTVIYIWNGPG